MAEEDKNNKKVSSEKKKLNPEKYVELNPTLVEKDERILSFKKFIKTLE
jgi:hypothetical protein